MYVLISSGEHLSNKPFDRVRDAATALPSHISAFGDLGSQDDANQHADPGSVKLPSHISAFGEGVDVLPDMLRTQDDMEFEAAQNKQARGPAADSARLQQQQGGSTSTHGRSAA